MSGETIEEKVTELETLDAPYGRTIALQDVAHESGMRILRMRIREGHRFTIIDLDADTTARLSSAMVDWAVQEKTEASSEPESETSN